MPQFNEFMSQLARLITWDIELAALSGSGKLSKENHPLAPLMTRAENRKRQIKKQGPLAKFINKLNKAFSEGKA
jgi:hypothetical protein